MYEMHILCFLETLVNVVCMGSDIVEVGVCAYGLGLGVIIARNLEEQLMRWLRAAELTCDRAALLVAQDPKV